MAHIVFQGIVSFMGVFLGTVLSATAPQLVHPTSGEQWSEPVEGVHGRIVLDKGVTSNGTTQIRVFLELQNISDIANPIHVLAGYTFAFEMTDSKGTSQPTFGGEVDVIIPDDSFGLVLPYASTLRFLVSVTGVGIPRDEAAQISVPSESGIVSWIIRRGNNSPEFLSGILRATIERQIHRTTKINLKLPNVQIPR